jgi:hypothetical protein
MNGIETRAFGRGCGTHALPLAGLVLAVLVAAAAAHAAVSPAGPALVSRHTLAAQSSRFELVEKNDPLEPGKQAKLDLYLSDFATNRPVGGARMELELRSRGAAQPAWSGRAEAAQSPGVYSVSMPGQASGTYTLLARIAAEGEPEELLLSGLEFGAVRGPEPAPAARAGRLPWVLVGILVLALAVTIWVASRRGSRRGTAGAAILLLATLGAGTARAHEGHDELPATAGALPLAPGATVYMAKEAQFLLQVRTLPMAREFVQRRLTVLGHVAPRSGGELDLVAPQSGRLYFAGGRAPVLGEHLSPRNPVATLVVVDSLPLTTPIDGIVTKLDVVNGQRVEAGQKLLTLLDPSVLWVHADVYEKDIADVEHSRRALVTSPAFPDVALEGRRVALGATQGEVPGAIEAWFEVPNRGGRLRVGALVQVAIELGNADSSFVVQRSALAEKDGKRLVFVHTAPEHFEAREVTVTSNLGERQAISGTLEPGERVVVSGSYQLLTAPVIATSSGVAPPSAATSGSQAKRE